MIPCLDPYWELGLDALLKTISLWLSSSPVQVHYQGQGSTKMKNFSISTILAAKIPTFGHVFITILHCCVQSGSIFDCSGNLLSYGYSHPQDFGVGSDHPLYLGFYHPIFYVGSVHPLYLGVIHPFNFECNHPLNFCFFGDLLGAMLEGEVGCLFNHHTHLVPLIFRNFLQVFSKSSCLHHPYFVHLLFKDILKSPDDSTAISIIILMSCGSFSCVATWLDSHRELFLQVLPPLMPSSSFPSEFRPISTLSGLAHHLDVEWDLRLNKFLLDHWLDFSWDSLKASFTLDYKSIIICLDPWMELYWCPRGYIVLGHHKTKICQLDPYKDLYWVPLVKSIIWHPTAKTSCLDPWLDSYWDFSIKSHPYEPNRRSCRLDIWLDHYWVSNPKSIEEATYQNNRASYGNPITYSDSLGPVDLYTPPEAMVTCLDSFWVPPVLDTYLVSCWEFFNERSWAIYWDLFTKSLVKTIQNMMLVLNLAFYWDLLLKSLDWIPKPKCRQFRNLHQDREIPVPPIPLLLEAHYQDITWVSSAITNSATSLDYCWDLVNWSTKFMIKTTKVIILEFFWCQFKRLLGWMISGTILSKVTNLDLRWDIFLKAIGWDPSMVSPYFNHNVFISYGWLLIRRFYRQGKGSNLPPATLGELPRLLWDPGG
jgi:hypothetical protein